MSDETTASFDHSGSEFDSLLEEDGVLEEVEVAAIKRVVKWQSRQKINDTRTDAEPMTLEKTL